MDDFLQSIYLGQAKLECEHCFAAIEALNKALGSGDNIALFQGAQQLVHHAAAVSRIFWPPGAKKKHAGQRALKRGEFLRNLLDIAPDHAVKARVLRDHFEHFDERLDDWAETSKHRNIVHSLVGPRSAIGGDAIYDSDIIHQYDPQIKSYAFRGERFDVQALATGLSDLHAQVVKVLEAIEQRKQMFPSGHAHAPTRVG